MKTVRGEFLKGGALSVDKLNSERAPPMLKNPYFSISNDSKSFETVVWFETDLRQPRFETVSLRLGSGLCWCWGGGWKIFLMKN